MAFVFDDEIVQPETMPSDTGRFVFEDAPFLNRSRVSSEGIQRGTHPLETIWAGSKKGLKEYGQPVIEGTALGVGAVAGAPLGPLGSAAGAGLLYAAAKQAFDEKKRGSFTEAGKDVATGAAIEASGQLAGAGLSASLKGAGWVWKKMSLPSLTRKGIEKETGDILVKNTSKGPVFARNAEEAAAIEEKLGGEFKFTRGQRTGDPLAVMQERGLSSGGVSITQNLEQQAVGNKIIRDYYTKNFPEGAGVGDVIRTAERNKLGIQDMESLAKKNLEGIKGSLGKNVDIQKSGGTIFDALKTAKEVARETKNKLYADIPNVAVSTSDDITREVKRLSKPYGAFENIGGSGGMHGGGGNLPQVFHDVESILQGPGNAKIGFQDLQSLKARLNNDIRMERGAQSPNDYKVKRLVELKDFVVKEMKKLGNKEKYGEAAERFGQAEKFYAEKYAPFRQGEVGKILRPGLRGEESRIASAEIASRFWKPDAADDFLRAVGDNAKAKQAMKDYAAHDLLKSATHSETGELVPQKVFSWYAKNRPMLAKFGLVDDFSNAVKASKTVNAWKTQAEAFDKSVASKILNADPEQAIASAFTGNTKNSIATVQELMNAVKGNKAGEDGLKKAMADHLMKQVETTAKDQFGEVVVSTAKLTKLIRQYEPALQVLYKNEPKKLEALKTIQKAYEILGRNQRQVGGSGSDTVEKAVGFWMLAGQRAIKLPVLRGVYEAFSGVNEKYRNEFLTRAVFDPEYAQTLIMISKGMPVKERMKTQLISLGIYGATKKEE